MLQIKDTLISLDIFDQKFKCNLNKCKGACCLHGDSGAPLEEEEKKILKKIFKKIKPYLSENSLKSFKKEGLFYKDKEGDWVTTLVDGKQCAYSIEENGIYLCAIEKAYFDKKIEFQKPISCHLYPVRIKKYTEFTAINYDDWDICKSAKLQGSEEDVSLYQFLKEPLIRKFGKEWYKELDMAAQEYKKNISTQQKIINIKRITP